MIEINAMTDKEVLRELEALQDQFSERHFQRLEGELRIRAACLGWTGDPLQQPPREVLASARRVLESERRAA